ncbi:MAG: cysteine hydrolase [Erysipelotrichaceae bacterium]|nr:cysteine hydrolase [Erysipelotrichaceae bacterium]
MKKLLVVVDVQNDFVDGSLGTPEAEGIIDSVVEAVMDEQYDDVIFTKDTHFEDYLLTQEGRNLPVVHCVKGTEGWQLNPRVEAAAGRRNGSVRVVEKNTFGSVRLAGIAGGYDDVTLIGLCTDICVISNALLIKAVNQETPIHVIEKACAGVTPEKHAAAIETMRSCQIDII